MTASPPDSRFASFRRSMGALLLLLSCTWALELVALLVLWRSQTLAPYAYFPNQTWDFVAKVRWFADPLLAWAPGLPDRFAAPAAPAQLEALAALLPATLATAMAVGGALALLRALVRPRATTLRGEVVRWTLLALVVHGLVAIPPFGLDEGLRLERLLYRGRSLILDGTMLAVLVALGAAGLAWMMAPLFARARAAATTGVLAVFAATALAAGVPPPAPAPELPRPVVDATKPRRNVVLISLDSLRADHVGAYGYNRPTSPNFDRFAKEGVLCLDAHSTSSWTLPTHLTMFTGLNQVAHGVTVDTKILPTTIPTLGEIFQDAGYATAGFVSGPYVAGHYGYSRGMDTYEDLSERWGKSAEARAAILSPEINEKALAWLDEERREPFFLFLHYFDIHYDFVPPPPYDRMFDPDYKGTMDGRFFIERSDVHPGMDPRDLHHIKALYDGEIAFTDAHVGRILARLDELGLRESTVVMIVSDHGDEFFEHGNKGHHRTVYDEVLRIPFALRLPEGRHAGAVIEEQVTLYDVFPTLLDAAGFTVPPGLEGESLVAWLDGAPRDREEIYSDFYDKRGFNLQVARRTPTGKTIQHFNRITHPRRGSIEYYDLVDDPAEDDNRAEQHPAEVETAVGATSRWLEGRWRLHRSIEAETGGASIEIDEETMKRLESLGYVGD